MPYHTFSLPEEKKLLVIVRGVLKVTAELEALDFNPTHVIRWSHRDGRPMPLGLIILPKKETHIYELNYIDRVKVRVETQRNKATNN